MMRVCPVVWRAWWRVKTWLFPWVDQSGRPQSKPRLRDAENAVSTAILNLSELLDDRTGRH